MADKPKLVRFDWAIKYLLRDKANFDILEGFLGTLLEDDGLKIIGLTGEESNQEDGDDKFNRVDLMVKDSNDQYIIIEVQTTRESDYLERLLFGTSKVVVESAGIGRAYKNIKKVISISILFFNLGNGTDYLYHGSTNFIGINDGSKLIIRRKETAAIGSTKKYILKDKNLFPEYYLIRVEKYKNIVHRKIDEWIYLIKNNEVKEGSTAKGIKAAQKKLNIMNMSKAERAKYDRFMINLHRELDMFTTARKEGRKEGIEIGTEKGRKEGIEMGQVILKLKTILKLIIQSSAWPPKTLASITELDIVVIQELMSVLKTKKLSDIQNFIQIHFLRNIKLSSQEQQEIDTLIQKIIA